MYLRENPVLQRELLVNLRKHRSFFLLTIYSSGVGVHCFDCVAARFDNGFNHATGVGTESF